MAKQARGLPDSFKLNVSASAIGRPVELGDYLDEELPAPKPVAPIPEAKRAVESSRSTMPPAENRLDTAAPTAAVGERTEPQPQQDRGEIVAMPPRPVQSSPKQAARAPQRQTAPKPQRLTSSVPRKQINMAPETITMVEQLLDYVQTYGVQKDLKGSELFHGLVLAIFEAREHIDLSRMQPRGRWGTPTAQALPIALKTAFQKAIQNYYREQQP